MTSTQAAYEAYGALIRNNEALVKLDFNKTPTDEEVNAIKTAFRELGFPVEERLRLLAKETTGEIERRGETTNPDDRSCAVVFVPLQGLPEPTDESKDNNALMGTILAWMRDAENPITSYVVLHGR